jgi:hypothetical protein
VRPEELGKLKNVFHLIGSQTHDLLACSIVPQPVCSRMPQVHNDRQYDSFPYHFVGKGGHLQKFCCDEVAGACKRVRILNFVSKNSDVPYCSRLRGANFTVSERGLDTN